MRVLRPKEKYLLRDQVLSPERRLAFSSVADSGSYAPDSSPPFDCAVKLSAVQKIAIAVGLLVCLLGTSSRASADVPDLSHKRVLLLFSYHPTFPTTDHILQGVRSVLDKHGLNLDVEFMDSKRLNDDISRKYFQQLLAYKLSRRNPYDLVMVSDDNAFNFVLEHQSALFPQTPVVFLAVNNAAKAYTMDSNAWVTGVVEAVSVAETMHLMRSLHPTLKRVVVPVDTTPSGHADRAMIAYVEKLFPDLEFQVLSLGDLSWKELGRRLQGLGTDTTVLRLTSFRDRDGRVLDYAEAVRLMVEHSSVPVYALRETEVIAGALGGYVVSHREQGRHAALMAERVLRGTPISTIPVMRRSPNRPVFHYAGLTQFGISPASVPEHSIVFQAPVGFVKKYAGLVLATLVVIVLLLGFAAYLMWQIRTRQRAEEALRESERRFRDYFKFQSIGLAITTPDKRFAEVNDKLCDIMGYSREELLNMSWTELSTSEDLKHNLDLFERAVAGEIDDYYLEKRFLRQDRKSVDVHLSVRCVRKADGTIDYFLTVYEDITPRKRAERALRRSEERFRNLIEGSIEGVLIDRWRKPLFANQSFADMLGYDAPQEVLALDNMDPCVAPGERERLRYYTKARMEGKPAPEQYEYDALRKDGSIVSLQNLVRVVDWEGEPAIQSTIIDITDRIRAEREAKRHLRHVDVSERIIRLGLRNTDFDTMLEAVLDLVLETFDCDRAWLVYPCDPDSESFRVDRERTKPAWPGALARNVPVPMTPDTAAAFARAMAAKGTVRYGPGALEVPSAARRFSVQAQMDMAIFPRIDVPWLFGMHFCADAHVFSDEEARLFETIGVRLAEAMNSTLALRDLRESEAKHRQLLELAQEGIWVIDKDAMTTFVNPAMAQMLGYSVEEMQERHLFSFMDQRGVELAQANLRRREQGLSEEHEFEFLRKDGSRLYAALATAPILDQDGAYAGAIAGVLDITARRRAEEALRESERRFRDVADASSDWIWETDAEHRFTYISGRIEAVTGLPPEYFLGKTRVSCFGEQPRISQDWTPHLTDLKAREPFREFTYRTELPVGVRYFKVSGKPRFDEAGVFLGYRGMGTDITEQVRAQEALRMSEARVREQQAELARVSRLNAMGEMATGLAHELNQPLAAIAHYCDAGLSMVGGNGDGELREVLEEAYEQAQRAGDIIRGMRQFVRRQTTRKALVDVNGLVRETLRYLRSEGRDKGVEVSLRAGHGVGKVLLDRTQIQQVVVNLVRNGFEALGNGHGGLREVRVGTRALDGEEVEVEVRDTGPGVGGGMRGRLFEPFATDKAEGMGMGLAISRSIVEAHGGRLWEDAEARGGACFRFALPRVGPADGV